MRCFPDASEINSAHENQWTTKADVKESSSVCVCSRCIAYDDRKSTTNRLAYSHAFNTCHLAQYIASATPACYAPFRQTVCADDDDDDDDVLFQ